MDELIAIVGGSWQPLLLYPGLVTAILASVLMRAVWSRSDRGAAFAAPVPLAPEPLLSAACMLLLLALLPFPRSYWSYPIDLIVALMLLEVPHWLRLAWLLRSPTGAGRDAILSHSTSLLNVYVLVALAVAALGQSAGSLLLPEIKGGDPAPRLVGLVVWGSAVPPLVALGPWYHTSLDDWLLTLRRVAHIALLVAIALPGGDAWGHGTTAIGAAIGFGAFTIFHYFWPGPPARWERLQPLIALALLAFLLATNTQAWVARLR